MGDDLAALMGFTLNVTARPALQVATFRHKSLTDSLINRGETWQSSSAHQYYLLIQINESQFNQLKCVKHSASYTRSIRTCDFEDGSSGVTHPESLQVLKCVHPNSGGTLLEPDASRCLNATR